MIKLWHVYLKKDLVFIPTVGTTDAGFFIDIDPVAVVESKDRQAIVEAVRNTITRGNPVVATPKRATFPAPIVLKYANVKSWSAFEKNARCWKVSKTNSTFLLCSQQKNPSGGWEDEPSMSLSFAGPEAVDDLAKALADKVQLAK